MPGLQLVRTYRREWLRYDLVAGLSVAAVALPIGIAYAQLAGFPPVVGIYSCILPAVAYALFGTSRQLVVNPDAAACAIVAATLAPLAAGDPTRYGDLSIVLALLTGLLCIAGGKVQMAIARAKGLFRRMIHNSGVEERLGDQYIVSNDSCRGSRVSGTAERRESAGPSSA